MQQRIRYYFNLGSICFIAGIVLLDIGEELLIIILLLFNILMITRNRRDYGWKSIYLISLISFIFTLSLFIIQYQYRRYIDFSCLKFIPDYEANISYLTTMLLFSIMSWELGFIRIKKKLVTS